MGEIREKKERKKEERMRERELQKRFGLERIVQSWLKGREFVYVVGMPLMYTIVKHYNLGSHLTWIRGLGIAAQIKKTPGAPSHFPGRGRGAPGVHFI